MNSDVCTESLLYNNCSSVIRIFFFFLLVKNIYTHY
uniref:Uncharacterized protein n=1 Tax=Lepeophtheirus salmonis TaxID=72036 RepID=A0A0K2VLP2_LEPSM